MWLLQVLAQQRLRGMYRWRALYQRRDTTFLRACDGNHCTLCTSPPPPPPPPLMMTMMTMMMVLLLLLLLLLMMMMLFVATPPPPSFYP